MKKLGLSRRKGVDLAAVDPVKTSWMNGGSTRCFVVEPTQEDVDLIAWAAAKRGLLDERLRDAGAVLFRGFALASAEELERLATTVCSNLFTEYGDLPRDEVSGRIYEATPYPADQRILYHNESSHMDRWPLKQLFFCALPSEEGGETPIADAREVYKRLDPALRSRFAERGLMYVRNFTPEIDVSWQEFFHTDDRAAVEEQCVRGGLSVEWKADGGLRTRRRCRAVAKHPLTGEDLFFNQIQAHHVGCLEPAVRASLLELFAPEDLPRHVYFGDGSPIPDAVMSELVALYDELSIQFPWRKRDLLMVDNMLMAHARNTFKGKRKIIVAMGDVVLSEELGES